jgi:hypothetical protein
MITVCGVYILGLSLKRCKFNNRDFQVTYLIHSHLFLSDGSDGLHQFFNEDLPILVDEEVQEIDQVDHTFVDAATEDAGMQVHC